MGRQGPGAAGKALLGLFYALSKSTQLCLQNKSENPPKYVPAQIDTLLGNAVQAWKLRNQNSQDKFICYFSLGAQWRWFAELFPRRVKVKRCCHFSASTTPRSDMFIAGICNSAVEGMKYGMCAVVHRPHPAQPLSTIGHHAALRQENFATASTTNLNHV